VGNITGVYAGQVGDTVYPLFDTPFREYDRLQGRWLSPDPAGIGAFDLSNPQSLNRYAYVANNPTNLTDPLGLDGDCTVNPDGSVTCPPTSVTVSGGEPEPIPLPCASRYDCEFGNPYGFMVMVTVEALEGRAGVAAREAPHRPLSSSLILQTMENPVAARASDLA
jgi:RHS repeat-associated protein